MECRAVECECCGGFTNEFFYGGKYADFVLCLSCVDELEAEGKDLIDFED